MFMRSVAAERLKLRRSRLWMILMILPLISVLIGTGNFYMNQGVLKNEWYSLWSQVALFYGEFFFPILIAICCAYIWRLEHFNKNWNKIMTIPVNVGNIFLAKLFMIGLLLIFVQGSLFVLYLLAGFLIGLPPELPAELFGWLFRGWIAGMTIAALQLALSMRFRSFALPVGIGLCLTFFGLGMYVMKMGMLFPHSLLTIGMGVLSQTGFSSIEEHLQFFTMNFLYIWVISIISIRWLRKKDVVA